MRNRWLIALAAIGIHISIGSVYAWSVLTRPIMAEMGITLSETTGVFSTAILFLGITTCFLGNFVEKIGPKKSALLSTAFFALAMFGTYLAISWHNLPLVYLFYGVLGGVGIGIGYMAPVSTLIRYFPHTAASRRDWPSWALALRRCSPGRRCSRSRRPSASPRTS